MNQEAGLGQAELEKIKREIESYIATLKGAPNWAVNVNITSLDTAENKTRVSGFYRLGAAQWHIFWVELTPDRRIKSFQG